MYKYQRLYAVLMVFCLLAFMASCQSGCSTTNTDVKVAQVGKASAESILVGAKALQNSKVITEEQYKEIAKYYDMYAVAQNAAIDARVAWLRAGKPKDATKLDKAIAASASALTSFMEIAIRYKLVE